jgi:hypothetical protein
LISSTRNKRAASPIESVSEEGDVAPIESTYDMTPASTPCDAAKKQTKEFKIKRSKTDNQRKTPLTELNDTIKGVGDAMLDSTRMLMPSSIDQAVDDFILSFTDYHESYILCGMEVLQDEMERAMYVKLIDNTRLKVQWMDRKVYAREPALRRYRDDYVIEPLELNEQRYYRAERRRDTYEFNQPGFNEEEHLRNCDTAHVRSLP